MAEFITINLVFEKDYYEIEIDPNAEYGDLLKAFVAELESISENMEENTQYELVLTGAVKLAPDVTIELRPVAAAAVAKGIRKKDS